MSYSEPSNVPPLLVRSENHEIRGWSRPGMICWINQMGESTKHDENETREAQAQATSTALMYQADYSA